MIWYGRKTSLRRDQYNSPEIQTKTTEAAAGYNNTAGRKKQLYIQTKTRPNPKQEKWTQEDTSENKQNIQKLNNL